MTCCQIILLFAAKSGKKLLLDFVRSVEKSQFAIFGREVREEVEERRRREQTQKVINLI